MVVRVVETVTIPVFNLHYIYFVNEFRWKTQTDLQSSLSLTYFVVNIQIDREASMTMYKETVAVIHLKYILLIYSFVSLLQYFYYLFFFKSKLQLTNQLLINH